MGLKEEYIIIYVWFLLLFYILCKCILSEIQIQFNCTRMQQSEGILKAQKKRERRAWDCRRFYTLEVLYP